MIIMLVVHYKITHQTVKVNKPLHNPYTRLITEDQSQPSSATWFLY